MTLVLQCSWRGVPGAAKSGRCCFGTGVGIGMALHLAAFKRAFPQAVGMALLDAHCVALAAAPSPQPSIASLCDALHSNEPDRHLARFRRPHTRRRPWQPMTSNQTTHTITLHEIKHHHAFLSIDLSIRHENSTSTPTNIETHAHLLAISPSRHRDTDTQPDSPSRPSFLALVPPSGLLQVLTVLLHQALLYYYYIWGVVQDQKLIRLYSIEAAQE